MLVFLLAHTLLNQAGRVFYDFLAASLNSVHEGRADSFHLCVDEEDLLPHFFFEAARRDHIFQVKIANEGVTFLYFFNASRQFRKFGYVPLKLSLHVEQVGEAFTPRRDNLVHVLIGRVTFCAIIFAVTELGSLVVPSGRLVIAEQSMVLHRGG